MSKEFNFSVYLSPEIKERLNSMAQRIGVPRESIIEFAVEEFLEDPELEGLTRSGVEGLPPAGSPYRSR